MLVGYPELSRRWGPCFAMFEKLGLFIPNPSIVSFRSSKSFVLENALLKIVANKYISCHLLQEQGSKRQQNALTLTGNQKRRDIYTLGISGGFFHSVYTNRFFLAFTSS